MKKPPHMQFDSVSKGLSNEDQGGFFPDAESVANYRKHPEYHACRVSALNLLISNNNAAKIGVVLDFGIGDGHIYRNLAVKPSFVYAVDISENMLNAIDDSDIDVEYKKILGGVEAIENIADSSCDTVLCIDTLGYLDETDQSLFFKNAHRVLKSNGSMIVMTGNCLLDMFCLNSGTRDFFLHNFSVDVSPLLTEASSSRFKNAYRHNPLSFGAELSSFGFREIDQEFAMWHVTPPSLLISKGMSIRDARLAARDLQFNYSKLSEADKWKRIFRSSIFCSLLKKV